MKLKEEIGKMLRLNDILWECKFCGYKWKGDDLDEKCPQCESEDIIIAG